MYRVGQEEVDAIAEVLLSGELFRYHTGGECERFENRYAESLGVDDVMLCSSGTTALTAALVGLGIGPGDEVLVPACTYMATALSVLSAGAIPVVVDVDESITISPEAVERAIAPHTRAVIPVHMWGQPCDMDALMRIADQHDIMVCEDACQAVGGAYEGQMLGSIGHAAAFSFNFYKNMTCGEGGAVATSEPDVARSARCMIDCCSFYWKGREDEFVPFASSGARASELEGAMLNVQLDRIDGIIEELRQQKSRILAELEDTALTPSPRNSPDYECGSHVMFTFDTPEQATDFAEHAGGTVCGNTGRHIYTEWDPIFARRGAHHPALDPFQLDANAECRMDYTREMCQPSLDIVNRTVMIATNPDRDDTEVTRLIETLRDAAAEVI